METCPAIHVWNIPAILTGQPCLIPMFIPQGRAFAIDEGLLLNLSPQGGIFLSSGDEQAVLQWLIRKVSFWLKTPSRQGKKILFTTGNEIWTKIFFLFSYACDTFIYWGPLIDFQVIKEGMNEVCYVFLKWQLWGEGVERLRLGLPWGKSQSCQLSTIEEVCRGCVINFLPHLL